MAAAAVALLAVLVVLGQAMMPQWRAVPFENHIAVESTNPAIEPKGVRIDHEGAYRTKQTTLTIETEDGIRLPAILREPIGATGARPACLFIHGSGTAGQEDFGDIANAMASAGIVTLVPAKRTTNYTPLHRDYARFARDYSRAFDQLLTVPGVDRSYTGVYAESEGTWISTLMSGKRQDIAFSILSSAPVFKGREQMAMAVSAYAYAAGAPEPVLRDVAKLMSVDFAPFDLRYADFDAARYLKTLTMPVLVNYGTLDPAMPIEQGAHTVLDSTAAVGNDNVTVRYFEANHQMRAGEGLFTAGLPLADGYTKALSNWVNGVTAGAGVDGWATPRIAGAQPDQHYAAPEQTKSGIIGSLGVLVGLMAGSLICLLVAGVLGLGVLAGDALRQRKCRRRRWVNGASHLRGESRMADDGWVLRGGRSFDGRRHMRLGWLPLMAGAMAGVLMLLLAGYIATVIIQALHGQSNATEFAVAWVVLQIDAVLCAVLCAWLMVRLCRAVHATRVGGMGALRWSACALVLLGLLAALTVMAFWGLFSW